MNLDFAELRAANVTRCARWHGPDSEPWVVSDWTNAMCGEAGEAANVAKKIRRQTTGAVNTGDPEMADLIDALAAELADTVIYADLVADHMGIDLAAAIAAKFNLVSERHGFPERLEPRRVVIIDAEQWAAGIDEIASTFHHGGFIAKRELGNPKIVEVTAAYTEETP